jgi:Holliday junction resolvase-like predicted endonuclease
MALATDTVARAMSEAKLFEGVADLLKGCGWHYFHISAKAYKGNAVRAGFLDLIAVKNGRLVFAELKRERQDPSDEQREWLEDLRRVAFSVEAYVWRPLDLLDGRIARILAGGQA